MHTRTVKLLCLRRRCSSERGVGGRAAPFRLFAQVVAAEAATHVELGLVSQLFRVADQEQWDSSGERVKVRRGAQRWRAAFASPSCSSCPARSGSPFSALAVIRPLPRLQAPLKPWVAQLRTHQSTLAVGKGRQKVLTLKRQVLLVPETLLRRLALLEHAGVS